ncbi:MAG: cyclic nucleotide-binding domain-containing protein [Candidatus Riflebacteria bacterium]|nr:cyclic nucleotide-binding domain-containing protein [Candidatus Riflebacteria bacterium]
MIYSGGLAPAFRRCLTCGTVTDVSTTLFIFGQLSDLDIEWMAHRGRRKRIPAGEVIIHRGVACDFLFVIFRGRFSVTIDSPEAVSHMRIGDVAGEMSLIQATLPGATVTAVEESVVFSLPKPLLLEKLETDDGFAARFYRGMAMLLSDRLATKNRVLTRIKRASSSDRQIWQVEDDVMKEKEPAAEAELDMEVLERLHLAGDRFRRLQESSSSLD